MLLVKPPCLKATSHLSSFMDSASGAEVVPCKALRMASAAVGSCQVIDLKNDQQMGFFKPQIDQVGGKSVGMILPNIWKNKKCSKPPTRDRKKTEKVQLTILSSNVAMDFSWFSLFCLIFHDVSIETSILGAVSHSCYLWVPEGIMGFYWSMFLGVANKVAIKWFNTWMHKQETWERLVASIIRVIWEQHWVQRTTGNDPQQLVLTADKTLQQVGGVTSKKGDYGQQKSGHIANMRDPAQLLIYCSRDKQIFFISIVYSLYSQTVLSP